MRTFHDRFIDSMEVTKHVVPTHLVCSANRHRRAAVLTSFSLLNFLGHLQTGVVEYNVKMARLHPPQQGNLAT